MEDKNIIFTKEEHTARIKAEFFLDGVMEDAKYLNTIEYDGLEHLFEEFPMTIEAGWMYEELEHLCFDDDGEGTVFEDMVMKLMYRKEN